MDEQNKEQQTNGIQQPVQQPIIGLPEVAPEPTPTPVHVPETEQLIDDELISQSPLMAMAAQSQNDIEQLEPVAGVEVSTEQSLDEANMQNAIANSTIVMNGEMTLDEVNAMVSVSNSESGSNDVPLVHVETQPVVEPEVKNETKNKGIVKIIVVVLILAILGIGGYFGFKLINKVQNEKVPKLIYFDETTKYYEDKYDGIVFKDISDEVGTVNTYQDEGDDIKITVTYNEEDKKVKNIVFAAKKVNEVYEAAKPFYYSFADFDQPKYMMALAEKYGGFNYNTGQTWFEFSKMFSNPSITVDIIEEFDENNRKFVLLKNDKEILLAEEKFKFNIINSIKDGKLRIISVSEPYYGDTIKFEYDIDSSYNDFSLTDKEVALSEELKDKDPSSFEEKDFNGQKILVIKSDEDTKAWIPLNKEDVDVNSTEKQGYLYIDFNIEDEIDIVLKSLSRNK